MMVGAHGGARPGSGRKKARLRQGGIFVSAAKGAGSAGEGAKTDAQKKKRKQKAEISDDVDDDVTATDVVGAAVRFRDGVGAWVSALITAAELDTTGAVSWIELRTHPVVKARDDTAMDHATALKTQLWGKESEVIVAPGWDNVRGPDVPAVQAAVEAHLRRRCFCCQRERPGWCLRVVVDSTRLAKKPRIASDSDLKDRLADGTLVWCMDCRLQRLQRQMKDPDALAKQRLRNQRIAERRTAVVHKMYPEKVSIAAGEDLPPMLECRMSAEKKTGEGCAAPAGEWYAVTGDDLEELVEAKTCAASAACRGGLEVLGKSQGPGGAVKYRAICRDPACRKHQVVDLSGSKITAGARTVGELKQKLDGLMARTPASTGRAAGALQGLPPAVGHHPSVDRAFLEFMQPIVDKLTTETIKQAREQCKARGCTKFAADGSWLHPGRTSDYAGEPSLKFVMGAGKRRGVRLPNPAWPRAHHLCVCACVCGCGGGQSARWCAAAATPQWDSGAAQRQRRNERSRSTAA